MFKNNVWLKIVDKKSTCFENFIINCYRQMDYELKSGYTLVKSMFYNILLSDLSNDNTFENILDQCVGYLPFEDCVYEFKNKKTITFKEANERGIYFSKKINYNYPVNVNKETYNKVKSKLFGKIFNDDEEQIQPFLNFVSRRLAGHNEKDFIMARGDRDSGKTVIVKSFMNSFPGFVDIVDGDEICVKKSMESYSYPFSIYRYSGKSIHFYSWLY